jgi:hypothetical protein
MKGADKETCERSIKYKCEEEERDRREETGL